MTKKNYQNHFKLSTRHVICQNGPISFKKTHNKAFSNEKKNSEKKTSSNDPKI